MWMLTLFFSNDRKKVPVEFCTVPDTGLFAEESLFSP